jgi:hypothetical protein
MAKLFILAALVALACANPTPQTKLPKTILALFQNIPEEQENYKEFAKLLGAPENLDVNKPAHIGFIEKDGQYVARFYFWPHVPSTTGKSFTLELPFKLGETQTKVIRGKNIEYVYTVDGDEKTPTLHAKYRNTDDGTKFTVEAKFDEQGVHVTYTSDNLSAKRHYGRVLPPYAMGAFINIPEKSAPNAKEFYSAVFPLPAPLTWTDKVAVWLAPEGDRHYVDKVVVHPSFFFKVNFTLGEKKTVQWHGESAEYEYRLVESTPEKTVLRVEMKCSKAHLVNEMTFTHDGFTYTTKKEGGEQTSGAFKRVMPFTLLGKFEDVPEKAENWEEFTKGCETYKTVPKYTEMRYNVQNDEYHLTKTGEGHNMDLTFKLNTPSEKARPDGKKIKFTVSVDGVSSRVYARTDAKIEETNETFTVATFGKSCGIVSKYIRGDVVATRYSRRQVHPAALGKFESDGETTEEFKTFANTIGAPQFLKKTTNEFVQGPDGNITQKLTEEGDSTVHEIHSRLGAPTVFEAHGHQVNYTTYYWETLEGHPIMMAHAKDVNKPDMAFRVTAIFRPDGYDAYYVYGGDLRYGGEKLATRKFKRVGAPVPLERPTPSQ